MSTALTLLGIGWVVAAAVMALLWLLRPRRGDTAIRDAAWAAVVGSLAVLYAWRAEHGSLGRRVAIASMMGSWGARRAVHLLYDRRFGAANTGSAMSASWWSFQAYALAAACCSIPAAIAAVNPAPDFSRFEYVAAVMWAIGFAGASTADRQLLAFRSDPENEGQPCRVGVWRLLRHPTETFEAVMWTAFALFASASL